MACATAPGSPSIHTGRRTSRGRRTARCWSRTDSWARIVSELRPEPLEQGAQALLLGAGSVRLVRRVALVHRKDLQPALDQRAALQAVEQALAGSGWVEAAAERDTIAYQISSHKNTL
jgi:hypothetical protein